MANRNLELALRITADLKQGRAEVKGLSQDLRDTGAAAQAGQAQAQAALSRTQQSLAKTAQAELVVAQQAAATATAVRAAATTQAAAQTGSATTYQAAAMSAKQYGQSMRQLPMQITDVTTSLASGMPVWMVAIQQGGQIRDSFGGITPAARAVMSVLSPLRLAMGGVAAAMAVLALAYKQGSDEQTAFGTSLALTGNFVGRTTGQLADLAEQIDAVDGTTRQAAQALAAAAGSGKITGDQLELVAAAAVRMQNATGRAVEDTVADFVKLAEDPAKASVSLNQKLHHLTGTTYAQIRALEEAGNKSAAAALAMSAYAAASDDAAAKIRGQMGYLEKAWDGVKRAAAETWDAMLGIGRETSLEDKLADARRQLEDTQRSLAGSGLNEAQRSSVLAGYQAEIDKLERQKKAQDETTSASARQADNNARSIAAQEKLGQLLRDSRSNTEKSADAMRDLERWIAEAAKGGKTFTDAQIAQARAFIQAQYKDKEARDPNAATRESLARLAVENRAYQAEQTRDIESQVAIRGELLRLQYADELKLAAGNAAQLRVIQTRITQEEAAYRKELLDRQEADRETAFQAVLADLAQRAQAEKQAAADIARLNVAYLNATGQASSASAAEIEQRYQDLRNKLSSAGDTEGLMKLQVVIDREKLVGELNAFKAEIERITRDARSKKEGLQLDYNAGRINQSTFATGVEQVDQGAAQSLSSMAGEAERLAKALKDPGIATSLQAMIQKLGEADPVMKMMGISTAALADKFASGLSNAIVDFASGTKSAKEAFGQFAASFLAGIAQMILQTMILNSLKAAGLPGLSGGGLVNGFASGGYTGRGEKYQPAGVVHAGEFVLRREVVSQPGAINFLSQMNRVGMQALSSVRGYADGGLVAPDVRAAAAPAYAMASPAAAIGSNVSLNQRLLPVLDPDLMSEALQGPAGEKLLILHVSRNPAKFRTALGVKG